jgi:hypothetical protein
LIIGDGDIVQRSRTGSLYQVNIDPAALAAGIVASDGGV